MHAIIEYDIMDPHDNDVIGGRGNGANNHHGNIAYRKLVAMEYNRYIAGSNESKKIIAWQIIDKIKKTNPPGRFLIQDKNTGLWGCMHDEHTLKKVCQRLREHAQPSQLKHQSSGCTNDSGPSITPPSSSAVMNIGTETSQTISPKLNSSLLPTVLPFTSIIKRHNSESDLKNNTIIAPLQQPHAPPSPLTPAPIYEKSNIDTNGCEVKDLVELFMAKSVDELKANIEAEKGKMIEVERIRVELENLQKIYDEREAALKQTDLIHMEAILRKKQSMKTISNNSGENIESRRKQFQDIKDESMRSVSEENIEAINLDGIFSVGTLNKSDDSSIRSIEFDSTLSLRTLDTAEVGYVCSQDNISLLNSDLVESWRTFSIQEESLQKGYGH